MTTAPAALPWKAHYLPKHYIRITTDWGCGENLGEQRICDIPLPVANYSEQEANAALIVRAVNNHEALVKALELAEMHLAEAFRNTSYDPDPYETDESKTVLGRIRSALARAKEPQA